MLVYMRPGYAISSMLCDQAMLSIIINDQARLNIILCDQAMLSIILTDMDQSIPHIILMLCVSRYY